MLTEVQERGITDFFTEQEGFHSFRPVDQICFLIWYVHARLMLPEVTLGLLKECFDALHLVAPQCGPYIKSLAEQKPPKVIKTKNGFKLHASTRQKYDLQFAVSKQTVAITRLLEDLPDKMPDLARKEFLSECLDCYRVGAFRASTIMAWNLAFAHLLDWIHADPKRLSNFNLAISKRYPRISLAIINRHDFEDLKEDQIIEVCNTAGLISGNIVNVLKEKLKWRNTAAHPSPNKITQPQVDDTIIDLINNVVLHLI